MKKYSLIFVLFCYSLSAFGATPWFDVGPDEFDPSLVSHEAWSAAAREAKDYISQTLEKVRFNFPELRAASKKILTSVKQIRKDIDVLQYEVERAGGPVDIIGSIVVLVEELEGRASDISTTEKSSLMSTWMSFFVKSPVLAYKYQQLIRQIDNLDINHLLRPVQRIIKSMREIFDSVLKIRSSAGSVVGPSIISDELVGAMRNLIAIIDALDPKLTDIIIYGKKTLGTVGTQFNLIKHLWSHSENLSELKDGLFLLKADVPSAMESFLIHLNIITQAADPLIKTIQNFNATLREKLAQKKKETGARFATPGMVTEQTGAIFQTMRGNFNSVIGNAAIALSSIGRVVKIVITSIIEGIKTQIDFDVLDPKAYDAAITIPGLVDQLIDGVIQLQEVLPR